MKVALGQLQLLLSIPCCEETVSDVPQDSDKLDNRSKPGPQARVEIISAAIEYISCTQRRRHSYGEN